MLVTYYPFRSVGDTSVSTDTLMLRKLRKINKINAKADTKMSKLVHFLYTFNEVVQKGVKSN